MKRTTILTIGLTLALELWLLARTRPNAAPELLVQVEAPEQPRSQLGFSTLQGASKRSPQGVGTRPSASPSYAERPPLSLKDVHLDETAEALLHEAEERAVQDCMRTHSLEYVPIPFESNADATADALDPSDLQSAGSVGYGLALNLERGPAPPPIADPNEAYIASMPPEQRRAFNTALLGEPPPSANDASAQALDPNMGWASASDGTTLVWDRRSCVAQATRAVYGDDVREQQLRLQLQAAENALWDRVAEDSAVRASLEQWSACMSAAGHQFGSPAQARASLADDYHAGKTSLHQLAEREVVIAKADAACQQSHPIRAAEDAALDGFKLELERDSQELIQSVYEVYDQALARVAPRPPGSGADHGNAE